MTYTVGFLSKNVILQTVTETYTTKEMARASEEMAKLLDSVTHPCFVLVDMSKMKTTETNLSQVKNGVRPLFTHERLTLILAYGTSDMAVINFIASFVANVFKMRVKLVKNQKEAFDYLISQDASLDGVLEAGLQQYQQQFI